MEVEASACDGGERSEVSQVSVVKKGEPAVVEAKESRAPEPELKVKKTKKHLVGENQERMNYLLQVSRYAAGVDKDLGNIGPSLGALATAIGRKCVIRMSSGLKRQICKGCGSALIPGVSSRVRLRPNRQKHAVVTCNNCKTIKRFVTSSEHVLWNDREEAILD